MFIIAGTIKGMVGIGLPTAAVGLMSQFMDPRQAIALMLTPILVANLWQAYQTGMLKKSIQTLWPFTLCMMVGMWIFSTIAHTLSREVMTLCVGLMIILFVATNLLTGSFRFPEKYDKPLQVLAGSVSGVLCGLTSLYAPAIAMYLSGRNMTKDEFIGALGFLLLVGALPLFGSYWQSGRIDADIFAMSIVLLIPTFVGIWFGTRIRNRLSLENFKRLLLFIFFLMGLNLIRLSL